jgi:hypothetical protein
VYMGYNDNNLRMSFTKFGAVRIIFYLVSWCTILCKTVLSGLLSEGGL